MLSGLKFTGGSEKFEDKNKRKKKKKKKNVRSPSESSEEFNFKKKDKSSAKNDDLGHLENDMKQLLEFPFSTNDQSWSNSNFYEKNTKIFTSEGDFLHKKKTDGFVGGDGVYLKSDFAGKDANFGDKYTREYTVKEGTRPPGLSTSAEREGTKTHLYDADAKNERVTVHKSGEYESTEDPKKREPKTPIVGDGGRFWRLRQLKRFTEEARKDNISVEEVMSRRLGEDIKSEFQEKIQNDLKQKQGLKHYKPSNRHDYQGGFRGWRRGSQENDRNYYSRNDSTIDDGRMRLESNCEYSRWRRNDSTNKLWANDTDGPSTHWREENTPVEALSKFEKRFLEMKEKRKKMENGALELKTSVTGGGGDTSVADSGVSSSTTKGRENAGKVHDDGTSAGSNGGGASGDVSTNDLNFLASACLRATLRGDMREAKRLEGLVAVKQLGGGLKTIDAQQTRERNMPAQQIHVGNISYKPKHLEEGESIVDLMRAEKCHSSADFELNVMNQLSRQGVADEDNFGTNITIEKKIKKRQRELSQHRQNTRLRTQQSTCSYCLDGGKFFLGASILGLSSFAYVCMQTSKNAVARQHLFVAPVEHACSMTQVTDEVYEHIRNFQKSIVAFFGESNLSPIFIETVNRIQTPERVLAGLGHHTLIDVIPIPTDRLREARAFSEAESEWSTHKKIIKVSGRYGIRAAVPKQFQYIHVDFGLEDGLAHIIEDEEKFDKKFAQKVVLGILDTDANYREFRDNRTYSENLRSLKASFSRFDWAAHTQNSAVMKETLPA